MPSRWRGRVAGLAIVGVLVGTLAASVVARSGPTLTVRGPDDRVLARFELPGGAFAMRYRNSLYRSLAEERYVIDADGRIRLVELAADELAVLEEYYAIDDPASPETAGGGRAWRADPAREVILDDILVAGTDLGQRTLLVDGSPPLELWKLVEDEAPSVMLEVDGT